MNFYVLQQKKEATNLFHFIAILLVTSYVGHDEVRSAHRAAITKEMLKELGIFRVFLLAEVPKREKFITQAAVIAEHNQFNDIVQGLLFNK